MLYCGTANLDRLQLGPSYCIPYWGHIPGKSAICAFLGGGSKMFNWNRKPVLESWNSKIGFWISGKHFLEAALGRFHKLFPGNQKSQFRIPGFKFWLMLPFIILLPPGLWSNTRKAPFTAAPIARGFALCFSVSNSFSSTILVSQMGLIFCPRFKKNWSHWRFATIPVKAAFN